MKQNEHIIVSVLIAKPKIVRICLNDVTDICMKIHFCYEHWFALFGNDNLFCGGELFIVLGKIKYQNKNT